MRPTAATNVTTVTHTERNVADLVQRTAQSIDDMWQSVWHDSSSGEKLLVAIVLLVTGLAIPVIPIVWIARFVAN
jgi:hypothetical protein